MLTLRSKSFGHKTINVARAVKEIQKILNIIVPGQAYSRQGFQEAPQLRVRQGIPPCEKGGQRQRGMQKGGPRSLQEIGGDLREPVLSSTSELPILIPY